MRESLSTNDKWSDIWRRICFNEKKYFIFLLSSKGKRIFSVFSSFVSNNLRNFISFFVFFSILFAFALANIDHKHTSVEF